MVVTQEQKIQNLLRELFQFDCTDLNFGIYRIKNRKREVVERFITQDLPTWGIEELERGARVLERIFKACMFAPVEV